MGNEGHSDEVSDANEEHVIGIWRKGNSSYKVAQNLVELCLYSSALKKGELVRNEMEYLAEIISKQF